MSRLATVLGVAALACAALGGLTQRAGDRRMYHPDRSGMTVYVTYNAFHSDLDVPTEFLEQGRGPSAAAVAKIARRPWVALGWGDAVFYQGEGFGPARALALLHAALWPRNASVIRFAAEDDPLQLAPGWRALSITLSPSGAEALRGRLDDSFSLENGEPVPTNPTELSQHQPDERFFRSKENAWAFHVCNHWTAELLNAAGVPITPGLDLSTVGLQTDLRWRARARLAVDPHP